MQSRWNHLGFLFVVGACAMTLAACTSASHSTAPEADLASSELPPDDLSVLDEAHSDNQPDLRKARDMAPPKDGPAATPDLTVVEPLPDLATVPTPDLLPLPDFAVAPDMLPGPVLDSPALTISAATKEQVTPDIAFDGTNFLVVWSDRRSGTTYDIYGVLVAPSGSLVGNSFVINNAINDQKLPRVAFDGTNYVVVWEDYRQAADGQVNRAFMTRVTKTGDVLDTTGTMVGPNDDDHHYPAIASAGGKTLIVWVQSDDPYVFEWIRGTFVANGAPTGSLLEIASNSNTAYGAPAVTATGSQFVVVWTTYGGSLYTNHLRFGRIGTTGTLLDPSGVVLEDGLSDCNDPNVAFDGSNYLATWHTSPLGGGGGVYARRVTTTGEAGDARLSIESEAGDYSARPAIAFGTSSYLTVTGNGNAAAYVSASQTGTATTFPVQSNALSTPRLAFGANEFFVVWSEGGDIKGARLKP